MTLRYVKSVCQSWLGAVVLSRNSLGGFHDDEGGAGDQIMGPQKPINTGLRDEVATLVSECHSQLSWAQFWPCQCHLQHGLTHRVGNAVPDAPRMRLCGLPRPASPSCKIPVVPSIECRTRHAQLLQCAFDRQV